jgi:putative flippase GtrA
VSGEKAQGTGVSVGVRVAAPLERSGDARLARQNEPGSPIVQFARFGLVGATGFGVNIVVFAALVTELRVPYVAAAMVAFLVAVSSNFTLNRIWTFAHRAGSVTGQGARFLSVSLAALLAGIVVLHVMVRGGLGPVTAQSMAIAVVMPLNFIGNRLWTFRAVS